MVVIALPPLGTALEAAREAQGLSQNEAGRRSGISGTRWRDIVRGVTSNGAPAPAPARRLALMALAVGLTVADLMEVGRDDAAEVLEGLQEQSYVSSTVSDPDLDGMTLAQLTSLQARVAMKVQSMVEERGE